MPWKSPTSNKLTSNNLRLYWWHGKIYNGMRSLINPALRWRRSVSIWTECVCVCENLCVLTFVKRKRDRIEGSRKRRQMAEDGRSQKNFLVSFLCAQCWPLLWKPLPTCPLFCRPRPPSSLCLLSRHAPSLLTARPPRTRRSVCASCSQSQSRCQSCACRCPWCRCRWSRSEWWRRRTSRRRPVRDQISGLSLGTSYGCSCCC